MFGAEPSDSPKLASLKMMSVVGVCKALNGFGLAKYGGTTGGEERRTEVDDGRYHAPRQVGGLYR